MTTPKDKEIREGAPEINENFFFKFNEELILTNHEVKQLEKSLANLELDDKTRSFFRSAHKFYKKLKENDFIISLEEIEQE